MLKSNNVIINKLNINRYFQVIVAVMVFITNS